MRILLIFANDLRKNELLENKRIFWEPLGIGYIASYLRQEKYHVDILYPALYGMDREKLISYLQNCINQYSIIGLSASSFDETIVEDYVSIIREISSSVKIVLGGMGPTCKKKEFLSTGVDYLVVGEGEKTFLNIVQNLGSSTTLNSIDGISYLDGEKLVWNKGTNLINNLNENVFPARDISEELFRRHNVEDMSIQIQTSRGCLGRCSFCSMINFYREEESSGVRTRSVSNVIDEIEILQNEHGYSRFDFMDENFFPYNKEESIKKARAFKAEIEKRKLNIEIFLQCHMLSISEELLNILRSINVRTIFVGIDSFNDDDLLLFDKDYGKSDIEDFLSSVDASDYSFEVDSEFRMKTGFINFTPISTFSSLKQNVSYIREYRLTPKKLIRKLVVNSINDKLRNNIIRIFPEFSNVEYFMHMEVADFYNKLYELYKVYEPVRTKYREIENRLQVLGVENEDARFIKEARVKCDDIFINYFIHCVEARSIDPKDGCNEYHSKMVKEIGDYYNINEERYLKMESEFGIYG